MFQTEQGVCAQEDRADSLTVVICTYTNDRWIILRRAIDATLKQIRPQDELVIVVDHNDALLAQCREYSADIKVLPNNHKRGLSGARNSALDVVQSTIIVFLDDDAVPFDGWLDGLRTPYADNRIYGVGGKAEPSWQQNRPKWFPDEFLWVVGCSHQGLPSAQEPVRNLLGANMSFRKIAFDLAGTFPEQMGRVGKGVLGCEETEFSIRLTQVLPDAILLYDPSSQVEHHIPQERASLRYFLKRCWAEGLSKAEVSRRVGRASALRSERYYVARVLPKALWNGIYDTATGDIWGAARSMAIILALAATTAGYGVGIVYQPLNSRR